MDEGTGTAGEGIGTGWGGDWNAGFAIGGVSLGELVGGVYSRRVGRRR